MQLSSESLIKCQGTKPFKFRLDYRKCGETLKFCEPTRGERGKKYKQSRHKTSVPVAWHPIVGWRSKGCWGGALYVPPTVGCDWQKIKKHINQLYYFITCGSHFESWSIHRYLFQMNLCCSCRGLIEWFWCSVIPVGTRRFWPRNKYVALLLQCDVIFPKIWNSVDFK